MLVLFTDTDTDVTPEVAKEYSYNLISMPYTLEGKEVYPYIDFETFDYKEYYNKLRQKKLPKTSGLSPADYERYFEPHFAAGNDILYVHFSEAMSGTFSAMRLGLESLKEKYPERKFYTIDTKGVTVCSYNIVKEVGDLYKAGKSVEEILEWAKTEVDKFAVYFFADDLSFFRASGRVSALSSIFGNLLGIRPIINIGSDGVMKSIDKAKGRKGAVLKIMEYVDTLQENIQDHRVIIAHTDCIELAEFLANKLKEKYENLNIEFVVANPTIGGHCGPDCVGICFHAKHR